MALLIKHIHHDGISLVLEHQSLGDLEPTRVHSRFSRTTTTIIMFPGLLHPCLFFCSVFFLLAGQHVETTNKKIFWHQQ